MDFGWRAILHAFLPVRCAACNAYLEGDNALCVGCLRRIPLHGRPVPFKDADYTLIAATSYASPEAQALIKTLKYEGITGVAATLALITAAAARDALERELLTPASPTGGREEWLMVPVPLYPKRERERGFNQSVLFAEALRHHEFLQHIPLVHALARTRHTDTQTEKPDYGARRANVAGCFAVSAPGAVRGTNVLLIDDVTTSGATLTEAVRVLRRAGAHRVTALVFAKA